MGSFLGVPVSGNHDWSRKSLGVLWGRYGREKMIIGWRMAFEALRSVLRRRRRHDTSHLRLVHSSPVVEGQVMRHPSCDLTIVVMEAARPCDRHEATGMMDGCGACRPPPPKVQECGHRFDGSVCALKKGHNADESHIWHQSRGGKRWVATNDLPTPPVTADDRFSHAAEHYVEIGPAKGDRFVGGHMLMEGPYLTSICRVCGEGFTHIRLITGEPPLPPCRSQTLAGARLALARPSMGVIVTK